MANISNIALFQEGAASVSGTCVASTAVLVDLSRENPDVSGSVLVTVDGADKVRIAFGDATVVADATSRPYLGNTQQVRPLQAGVTHASIYSTGTPKVDFTEGNGA